MNFTNMRTRTDRRRVRRFVLFVCSHIILLFTFSFLLSGSPAHAQGLREALPKLQSIGPAIGAPEASVEKVAGRVINAALTLVGTIFFVLMVYAGYLWMTARGNEQQIEKAKNIVIAAVTGLVLIVSAYAITVFVTGTFG